MDDRSEVSDGVRSDFEASDGVRTDYNNTARKMDTSGLYLLTPSRANHAKYALYFPATTQLGTRRAIKGFHLKNRLIAANPVLSIPRRQEPVATDTL